MKVSITTLTFFNLAIFPRYLSAHSFDTDISNWYQMKWSRRRAFPFGTISQKYEVIWTCAGYLATASTWSVGFFLVKWLESSDAKTGPGQLGLHPPEWVLGLSYWVRTSLMSIEIFLLCFRFSIYIRRRWAAVFYDTQEAQQLLSSHDPSISLTVPTHIPLFVIGVVLMIWWLFSHDVWTLFAAGTMLVEPFLRLGYEMVGRACYPQLAAYPQSVVVAYFLPALTSACWVTMLL